MANGMIITSEGKNAILRNSFITNGYLALGNLSGTTFTELEKNKNYDRIPIKEKSPNGIAEDGQVLYVSLVNGIMKNLNNSYFPDADDGVTEDSLTETTSGGWGTINAVGIYRGETLSGSSEMTYKLVYAGGISTTEITQGKRVKFPVGSFQITLNLTEVGE